MNEGSTTDADRKAGCRAQAGCLGMGTAGVLAAAGTFLGVNRLWGPFQGSNEVVPLGAAVLAMAVVLGLGVVLFGIEEIPAED